MKEAHRSARTIFHQFLIVIPIIALTVTTGLAASITLQWDPSDPQPDGYRIFVRGAGEAYDYSRPGWEGNGDTCTIEGLDDQTVYFFVARAYMGDVESADSGEVYYAPPTVDSDGDGMADRWELAFGLDYLSDDGDGDADGDGISNRDEYRAGLEPDARGTGTPPNPPVAFYPEPDVPVDPKVMLEVESFADADGDANTATQWQIYDTQTGVCLMDVVTDRDLTLLPLPELLLKGNGRYWWQARFFDSGGLASDWSAESRFITEAAVNDGNGNGIPDDQEVDATQATISRSLVSPAVFVEPTALEVSSADTASVIERIGLLDPLEFDVHESTPAVLPFSMLAYRLVLDQPGQRVSLTIQLSEPMPADAQWVGYDDINGWKRYADQATVADDRKSVTVEVRDGGFGDADGVANGIIVDSAGLQSAAEVTDTPAAVADTADVAGSDTGAAAGGGGCFLAATGTFVRNDTPGWDWIGQRIHDWWAAGPGAW